MDLGSKKTFSFPPPELLFLPAVEQPIEAGVEAEATGVGLLKHRQEKKFPLTEVLSGHWESSCGGHPEVG